ncbi:MAG: peptidyl-prolyl cis-trans isomerase [Holophagaceae bacterium]
MYQIILSTVFLVVTIACNGPLSASLKQSKLAEKDSQLLASRSKIEKEEKNKTSSKNQEQEKNPVLGVNITSNKSESVIQEEILVAVNSHIITKKSFQQAFEQQNASLYRQFSGKVLDEKLLEARAKTLQGLIDAFLLADKATEMGITIPDDYIDSTIEQIKKENKIGSDEEFERALKANLGIGLSEYRKNQKRMILEQQVLGREVYSKMAVTENEVRAYYEQNKDDFRLPERFRIRELVIPRGTTPEEISKSAAILIEIKRQIQDKKTFESLVRTYSTAPTKDLGGDAGWINKGMLRPSIEEAALALNKGDISSVIETARDYYFVQLIDRESTPYQPFAEVKDKLIVKVQEPKAESAIEQFMNNLRTRANIRYMIPKDQLLKG